MVAKYWNRCCAKYDTIGFYGPAPDALPDDLVAATGPGVRPNDTRPVRARPSASAPERRTEVKGSGAPAPPPPRSTYVERDSL